MGLLPGAGLGQCVMVLSFNFLAKGLGLGYPMHTSLIPENFTKNTREILYNQLLTGAQGDTGCQEHSFAQGKM